MTLSIATIVEGQSEVESIPILLRKILKRRNKYEIQVCRPFRVKRNRVVLEGEIEKAIRTVSIKREQVGAILVLLDADTDCPGELGPKLLKRCKVVTQLPVAVVLANKEYECWLLGAKVSLRGKRGIIRTAQPPLEPEAIRGAKARLSRNMDGQSYLEIDDQPALTDAMDIDAAQSSCPSFDKMLREVDKLVDALSIAKPVA